MTPSEVDPNNPCPSNKQNIIIPTNSAEVSDQVTPVVSTLNSDYSPSNSAIIQPNTLPFMNSVRPELEIKLYTKVFHALLDTGASISAIADHTFQILQQSLPEHQVLNILPINGVVVSTALRSKSKKVTSQVLLSFSIGDCNVDCVFLVVPNLSIPFILGADWLSRYNVILNYKENMIHFPDLEYHYPFRVFSEKNNLSVLSSLRMCESHEPVFRSHIDQHIFSTRSVVSHISQTDIGNPTINTLSSLTNSLEPFDNIKKHVQDITSLSPQCKTQLLDLLLEYHCIFSNRPECNKLYTCRFDVIRESPFKIRPYPVPFSQRPAVEQELNRMLE